MRVGVAGARMAAAISEGVELLDIGDVERGLGLHPGAQAHFERAVRQRLERSRGQAGRIVLLLAFGDEHARLVVLHRDDRGGQSDLDRSEIHALTRDRAGTVRPHRRSSPDRDYRPP
jgi:hypothetical protein